MEAFYPDEEATASFQQTFRINPLSESTKSRRNSRDFNMEINPLRASRLIINNVATSRSSATSRSNLTASSSATDGQLERSNDYIDEVLEFLGLTRFRINCNKLLIDGVDLHSEILNLERRNLSLEQELSMWKTSSETQAAELRSEVSRANEEVSTVKEQLDSTISAADKCIEELEEQIRKYEEEKHTMRTLSDKRVIDLEELLRKTRDDKTACAGLLGNAELELKRQKEEVAAMVARNNFLKAEGDSRVGLIEDKLRESEEGRVDLQKQLSILSSSRDAAEKSGREIQQQHDKVSAELAALKAREQQGNVSKQQLKEKITELETQSKVDNAEITRMLAQLQVYPRSLHLVIMSYVISHHRIIIIHYITLPYTHTFTLTDALTFILSHTFYTLTHIPHSHTYSTLSHTFYTLTHVPTLSHTFHTLTHIPLSHIFHTLTHIPHSHSHSTLSHTFHTLTHIPHSHTHSALSHIFHTLTHILHSHTHSTLTHIPHSHTHSTLSHIFHSLTHSTLTHIPHSHTHSNTLTHILHSHTHSTLSHTFHSRTAGCQRCKKTSIVGDEQCGIRPKERHGRNFPIVEVIARSDCCQGTLALS